MQTSLKSYWRMLLPEKGSHLSKKGIRRNLGADMIASNVKDNITHLSQSQKAGDRHELHNLIKATITSPLNPKNTSAQKSSTRFTKKYLPNITRRSWRSATTTIPPSQKKRRRGLSEEVMSAVHDFWLSPSVSRPMPLKKRVKHRVPTHLLECSFKKDNPSMKIGYVKFIQLRPSNVRHMKAAERIVCCCVV